jgi:hypothetical protein
VLGAPGVCAHPTLHHVFNDYFRTWERKVSQRQFSNPCFALVRLNKKYDVYIISLVKIAYTSCLPKFSVGLALQLFLRETTSASVPSLESITKSHR